MRETVASDSPTTLAKTLLVMPSWLAARRAAFVTTAARSGLAVGRRFDSGILASTSTENISSHSLSCNAPSRTNSGLPGDAREQLAADGVVPERAGMAVETDDVVLDDGVELAAHRGDDLDLWADLAAHRVVGRAGEMQQVDLGRRPCGDLVDEGRRDVGHVLLGGIGTLAVVAERGAALVDGAHRHAAVGGQRRLGQLE